MKKIYSICKNWAIAFLHPRPLIGIFYLPRFFAHYYQYKKLAPLQKLRTQDLHPCLGDWVAETPFDPHYFYQGAWLARKLKANMATEHVDISSSALTMSVLSAFVNTTFVDFRPLKAKITGLSCIAGDILNLQFLASSISSLSCLHVIEHIGLGRYGDPLDPNGSVKAALELQRVVQAGGKLMLSVPVGVERVCFNAHRVFNPKTIIDIFDQMKLVDFSLIDDDGSYQENCDPSEGAHLNYGCGLFTFEKITPPL